MNNKQRINKYDNLRGLAILLIVLGHMDVINALGPVGSKFIFLIDLPLFFFVSGYFSKIGPDEPLKAFKRILIPYLIFSVIMNLFNEAMGLPCNLNLTFLQTPFALWFLIALFFMKMALPIVDKFKFPIITSIICALIMGFITMDYTILGITRAVAYFPIFLAGFYFKDYKKTLEEKYSSLYNLIDKRFILVIVLTIVLTIVAMHLHPKFFVFKEAYKGDILVEMIKRLFVLILMILWCIVLNRVMTNRKSILTIFGINSMAVYLLHGYIRYICEPTLTSIFIDHRFRFIVFLFIFTFAVVYILSRDVVTKYLNKFTDSVYYLIVETTK